MTVAVAMGALAGRARAAPLDPRVRDAIAAEMMPDDPLGAADGEILARVHLSLTAGTRDDDERTRGRRTIETIARRHARLLMRWLLGDDRRVALGYERGALMDVLISSRDARANAVAVDALLARPGLGYCMRALPRFSSSSSSRPSSRGGRLAAVLTDLEVIESLRRQAALLLLSDGTPEQAERTAQMARRRVEEIATLRPGVVRRWLLDQTDAGIFDSYRAAVVSSFSASTSRMLRILAEQVASRRAHLAPTSPIA